MADQPTTPSGSRWEPDPDATATEAHPDAGAEHDAAPGDQVPGDEVTGGAASAAEPYDDQAAVGRRARLRGRAILAGGATALALGAGLAGFVIGHSTAGDGTDGFRPARFQQGGPGQQPGDGRQGQPGFGNQDGDGFGGPPASDDDSSDGSTNDGDRT